MPADSNNRTLVLSVVAVDLVGYSRKSVAEQMSLKETFNRVLLEAIRDIAVADRIILDTGDGVAMGFLGDPEDALYVAMYMHDAINRDHTGNTLSGTGNGMDGSAIRIGINLGPVKLATGAGGHPNIIGDGINVAERIMAFAQPGQLTASHAVYEIMSRMSDHYATLFQYIGVHTDKQVRSHDVYVIGKSTPAFRQAQRGVAERAAARHAMENSPAHGQAQTALHAANMNGPISTAGPISTTGPISGTGRHTHPGMRAAESTPGMKGMSATSTKGVPLAAKTTALADVHADARSGPHIAGASADMTAEQDGVQPSALIDFLEDRNKVAATATMLVITAIVLAALLFYRKMQVTSPTPDAQVASATAPAPAANSPPPVEPPPAVAAVPVVTAPVTVPPAASPPTSTATAIKPVPETKSTAPPVPVPVNTAPAKAAAPISAPAPATATPTKAPERASPSAASEIGAAIEKSKEPRNDKGSKTERVEKADSKVDRPVKPDRPAPRNSSGTSAPVVPAYQSPVEPPRPEAVAPTPTPAPPPAPVADTRVIRLTRTDPAYPIEAIRQSIPAGYVRAKISIDANGNVTDVTILESRPISAFGRETRITAQQWKYNPGAPGRTQEVEFSFKP